MTADSKLPLVRFLLQRALFDLDHGWPEAAYDALARAAEMLRDSFPSPKGQRESGFEPRAAAGTQPKTGVA